MVVVSLFDGLGGGITALKRAGVPVTAYYSSEIEESPMRVAKRNHPEIQHIGSVTEITEEWLRSIGPVDLLIGGSPCQGFSLAGKMEGSSTTEGVDVVSLEQYLELKEQGFEFKGQSYLFWEYVRIWKILKPKYFFLENVRITKKWLPMFNETMGTEPIIINSSLLSAQNRLRFYWTNIPEIEQPKDKGLVVGDILEAEVASKYYLSEKAKKYMGRERNGKPRWEYHKNPIDGKGATVVAVQYKGVPYGVIEELQRRLTPIECERLQTLPDGYTEGESDSARYKMIGNGWTIEVIAHIFRNLGKEPTERTGNISDILLQNRVFNDFGGRI